MNRTQEVIFAVAGQSFGFDVPEGRPDVSPSPTLTVVMNMSADSNAILEAATTGSVAIDAVNTTISASIAAGETVLALASGSGVVRLRAYWITDATTGAQELVEVVAVVGTRVTARRPLLNAYTVGAAFMGTRLSIGVNSTWVNDQSRISDVLLTTRITAEVGDHEWGAGYSGYRLRWTYSVGGSPTIGVSYADVVRYQAKNLVTPIDVDNVLPGWIDRLPSDHRQDQGARLITSAFRAVRMDAMGDDQVVRRIRNTEVVAELVIYRANLMAAEIDVLDGRQDTGAVDLARRLYEQRYNQLLREPKVQVDQLGDGSAGGARRLAAWRR